jgi:uncharacterized protein YceK
MIKILLVLVVAVLLASCSAVTNYRKYELWLDN